MQKPRVSTFALRAGLVLCGLTPVGLASAADDTVAATAESPHPTLHNLSIT